jgi:glycosyltransferase involved in cell wall biosynthesis
MGNKRKVLFIIDSLTCGGAEKSLISLLPLLDYSKVQIDLMLVERGGVFEQYIPTDVNVVDFPRSQTLFFRVTQLCFSILLKVLRRRHGAEVRWLTMNKAYDNLKEEYDVAVAYQQGFPTYYVAEKVQAKRKYAWVNADLSKAGYNEQYNHQFYHVYDKVVPVSDILCDMLRGTGYVDSTKLYTVYDILNVDLIWKMSREPLEGSSRHEVTIVTTGRLAPPKNHILAVETAAILKKKGIDFVWYFVGEGSERIRIERLIQQYALEEQVRLVGMKPNPYPYMAMADVYVQTSSFEGFGLTINEARILHKPVVSTNFPVVYNQIKDGENGLIAEMNPESVAEKILMLINDNALRERIIDATKREVNTTSVTEPQKVMDLLLA